MAMASLLQFTDKGIYCPTGDFYIDPWKPVNKALITHAHSDHARPGHKSYLCHNHSVRILKHRLSGTIKVQGVQYGQDMRVGDVNIRFVPAGHILGSAQILVENKHERWVVSGDYKIKSDGLAEAYEPVKCDYFITESTFGLPVFRWDDPSLVFDSINQWWSNNAGQGITSIISAYSLGKAQRILQGVNPDIGPIYTHAAVENINKLIRQDGIRLRESPVYEHGKSKDREKALLICPPAASDSSWTRMIKNHSLAFASGWMRLRGTKRRRGVENGFILSDHADWNGLNHAIEQTGAQKVFVTHGYTDIFAKWLESRGIAAEKLETAFTGESIDNESD